MRRWQCGWAACSAGFVVALAVGTVAQAQVAAVQDWPQFRGPGGMGIAVAKSMPVNWSGEQNIAWKVELPGPGASSPVVSKDRIFVTCYSGYAEPGRRGSMEQLTRHVLALSRRDGQLLWRKDFPAVLPEQESVRDHGYASSTPLADGERLYVFFGKSGVIALDYDGRQLWHTDVGSGLNGWGSASSPVLVGELVIVNASVESDSLVALNRKDGKVVWRARGMRETWNTPILVEVGGRTELVVAIMGKILGIDPQSGENLWSCDTDIRWYMVPSLVAEEGIVYCVGGRSGGGLAVRAGGRGDVTDSHRLWTTNKGSNVTSPVLHDGHLYWMHESQGIAYCAQAASGRLVYEERIGRAGQVYASAVLADGKIYYVSRNGRTTVVAARPEYEQLAHNELGDRSSFDATPAIADAKLFIRSDRYLYCIGQDGR
jgi:outer membrane protein assembly factor BamB